ncbi:TrmB family transcriptional regulator [Acetohalobium arabaticum]|uniref:Transcriptional regulator, TrmB n=1 Tax=Acetohalobium arabaticum (strain ATCC 49924 / DSM 5501 / Z-7288) TaxID=574087 RepID=D9QQI2_ACEAZ|nr:TrmB family transcriptional regulator [Acetohalobium arabaticum]ADL12773.1 transcriptional regulator, TrmB [Acetohalobium arabaticum DSM 5501]
MDLKELLTYFNLTRQEAAIYLSLTVNGPMTGYEVAKETGISRSSVYTNLANLVDKGAAYLIEDKAKQYTPAAIDEFCSNKIRELKEIKKQLIENMPQRQEEDGGYITIKGRKNILNKIKNMIKQAEKRIYISSSDDILKTVLPYLEDALARELKVVIITQLPLELNDAVIYQTERKEDQIRLIVDSVEVLTGEIINENNSTCLYSKKENLVNLFKESLRNEIKLIKLTEGDDLE